MRFSSPRFCRLPVMRGEGTRAEWHTPAFWWPLPPCRSLLVAAGGGGEEKQGGADWHGEGEPAPPSLPACFKPPVLPPGAPSAVSVQRTFEGARARGEHQPYYRYDIDCLPRDTRCKGACSSPLTMMTCSSFSLLNSSVALHDNAAWWHRRTAGHKNLLLLLPCCPGLCR